jgi:hypothetical protein
MVRKTQKSEMPMARVKKSSDSMMGTTWKIMIGSYRNLFLGSFLLFTVLFSFLYGIWQIPFVEFGIMRMSPIGVIDYVYVIVVGLLLAILYVLGRYEQQMKLTSESKVIGKVSGIFAGLVAAACPVCQGIVLLALGSTLLTIPLGPLVPYFNFLKVVSLALLVLAVFFRADSIHTKTCIGTRLVKSSKTSKGSDGFMFEGTLTFTLLVILVGLIVMNQFLIPNAYALTMVGGSGGNIGHFEYGSKQTLKPMPLAAGEQPAIAGAKTKVKPLPTISELDMTPSTGDPVQDLLNNVVPHGTPWYSTETGGVTFDDPIAAQKLWMKGEAIQLDSNEQERWNRIVNSFTCDYCCGSLNNPTIITRCGCAHAVAARGMAKWFIEYHGSEYSDEEIYGEMARWYALWYPKGTIERIIQESTL